MDIIMEFVSQKTKNTFKVCTAIVVLLYFLIVMCGFVFIVTQNTELGGTENSPKYVERIDIGENYMLTIYGNRGRDDESN